MLSLTRRTLQILAVVFAVAALLIVALSGLRAVPFPAMILTPALIGLLFIGTRLAQQASPRAAAGIVGAAGLFLAALGTLEVMTFPTMDRVQALTTIVAAAEPQLKSGPVAIYCGDETIRATLDHAINLRLENVCGTAEAERLLHSRSDQQFLVLLAPPRSTQRVSELFPEFDLRRWPTKSPRPIQRLVELQALRLQPLAQWSAPGGRKYALYGQARADQTQ
jgi:hypothetical protein